MWKFCGNPQFPLRLGANRPKLCGNCAFPQNVHTRKLGGITIFYAVTIAIFLYTNAETSDFVCLKNFKERDTFTEMYTSTISIANFLILHFCVIKKFIPYSIYARTKRTLFLTYFVSQFIVSYMPVNTYPHI